MIVWKKPSESKPTVGEIVVVKVIDPVSGREYLTNSIWTGTKWQHKVVFFAGWRVSTWSYPS